MDRVSTAYALLKNKCVSFAPHNPFTYASGLKGPIYCDNRQLLSYPLERTQVIEHFVDLVKAKKITVDVIAGLATAGIAHAALLADRLKLPMVYIRSKAKEHGKQNLIEGKVDKGQRVLLVEDLVNQASSMESAVLACRQEGLEIVAAVAIVDYQMQAAKDRFAEWKFPLYSLTNFAELADEAVNQKLIDQNGRKILDRWHADPKNWQN